MIFQSSFCPSVRPGWSGLGPVRPSRAGKDCKTTGNVLEMSRKFPGNVLTMSWKFPENVKEKQRTNIPAKDPNRRMCQTLVRTIFTFVATLFTVFAMFCYVFLQFLLCFYSFCYLLLCFAMFFTLFAMFCYVV